MIKKGRFDFGYGIVTETYTLHSDANKFNEEIKERELKELKDGLVIYSIFELPLVELKKVYPKCTVTKDVNKCDVVIVEDMQDFVLNTEDISYYRQNSKRSAFRECLATDLGAIPMLLYGIEEVSDYQDKKFLELRNIFLGDKFMDDETFERIYKMCSGEFWELGLKLLKSFDTLENKTRLSICIGEVLKNSNYSRKKFLRFLMNKNKSEYITIRPATVRNIFDSILNKDELAIKLLKRSIYDTIHE